MKLNLPILDLLTDSKSILIAGMGGGFDVYSGLPLYLSLQEHGLNVHLANFSFSDILNIESHTQLSNTMIGVDAAVVNEEWYFPEHYLATWFNAKRGEGVTIWAFHKTGVVPLIENYRLLVDHLEIDAIILIDGGVDSLMHGDEHLVGTIMEDTISLAAVNTLTDVPLRIVAAVGLGIEPEVGYAHLFENIAELTRAGAFLGSCSLVKAMPVYQQYEEAVLFAFERIPGLPSVICSSLVSAVRGEFGNFHLTARTNGSHLRISPLMPLYWFFDLPAVAERNLVAPNLMQTVSAQEALISTLATVRKLDKRPRPGSPLHGVRSQ